MQIMNNDAEPAAFNRTGFSVHELFLTALFNG
jgi:hypothetical protein